MTDARVGRKTQLAHRADQLLDPGACSALPRSLGLDEIESLLRGHGAGDSCVVVREYGMKPTAMRLTDALAEFVFADDAVFISCIPGRLAVFSDEAPGDQWLLRVAI